MRGDAEGGIASLWDQSCGRVSSENLRLGVCDGIAESLQRRRGC